MRINKDWAALKLGELCRQGFLTSTAGDVPGYQYQPRDSELDAAVSALALWYTTHWVAIIGMIHSKPADKLRAFANAFRIRGDKTNG